MTGSDPSTDRESTESEPTDPEPTGYGPAGSSASNSEPSPSEPLEHPRATFIRALSVPRNATIGFGVGVLLAAFLLYGVLEGPPGRYSLLYYVGLGFVLAVGVGLLVTLVLTVLAAVRLVSDK